MTYAILTFISLVLFAVMVVCFLLSCDDPINNDVVDNDVELLTAWRCQWCLQKLKVENGRTWCPACDVRTMYSNCEKEDK